MMLKKRKSIILMLVAALILVLFTACGSKEAGQEEKPSSAGESVKLKLAHSLSEKSAVHQGYVKFGELIKERTNGRYEVVIYPNSQLGTDNDIAEAVQIGSVDIVNFTTSTTANYSPIYYCFDVPFAFPDHEYYDAIVRGELKDDLVKAIESDMSNVKYLDLWERGYRVLTSDIEIREPKDMAGFRLRILENALHKGFWTMVGADPATLSFSDVYVALQQKAMQGQDNPPATIYDQNFHEVQNYLVMTNHIMNTASVIMNANTFNSMSKEDQAILMECIQEAGKYQDGIVRDLNELDVTLMEKDGITVIRPDMTEWMKIGNAYREGLYEKYPAAMSFLDKCDKALKN
jgi:tripartite ATP-independent transporter DctP family solute receptor